MMCAHMLIRSVHASKHSAARCYRGHFIFGRNSSDRISCCTAEPMNEMDVAGCRGDLTIIRVHAGAKDRRSIDARKLKSSVAKMLRQRSSDACARKGEQCFASRSIGCRQSLAATRESGWRAVCKSLSCRRVSCKVVQGDPAVTRRLRITSASA